MSEKIALPSSIVRRGALPVAAACALLCGAALAQDRGRLLGVEAGGDASASSVDLIGDRPLSFTTLKLRGPPRVVVDFADTELSGIPRELAVDDGTIRRVAAAAAGQRTARVVIELAGEAEFDVRAQGNRVQVRVPRIAPLLAAAEPQQGTSAAPSGEAAVPSAAQPPAQDRGASPQAAAEPAAVPPPEDAAARKRREAADARRAAVDRAEAAQKAARERRLAAAERADADRRARAEKAAAAKKARAVAAAEKAAAQSRAKAARKAAPQRKLAMAGALHAITGIGFRPIGAGEVIVRSDHPLEYGVSREGDAVVLHLPKAVIPLPNNRRELDTQFFNGPVLRVVPLEVEGGTDLLIELRGRAEYQLAQSGGVLTVTFSAPR